MEKTKLQHRLHEIIYEADTPIGKLFDLIIIALILLSVVFVALDSVQPIYDKYHKEFNLAEWVITIIFTIEYIARILAVKKPIKYIFSFYGIVDLLAILPQYISLFLTGSEVLASIRALRLLRVFRILKLTRYVSESNKLMKAMRASRAKISVFLYFLIIICVLFGTLMYLVESDESGFTSIPESIYWCIVTLTTVGYGDIAPITPIGQFIAAFIMVLGYGIIAVPTGIVSAEFVMQKPKKIDTNTQHCPHCSNDNHKDKAIYCHKCGGVLNDV